MLSNQNCYLLSQVVVKKPKTKKVQPVRPVVKTQPMTMQEAFLKINALDYIKNKF
jgi:hypothetical protein